MLSSRSFAIVNRSNRHSVINSQFNPRVVRRDLHGKNFIGFETSAEGDKNKDVVFAINPVTGNVLDDPELPFFAATSSEIDRAMKTIHEAGKEFKKKSPEEVSNLLKGIASEIEKDSQQIIQRAMLETAYPEPRLTGEMARTLLQLRYMADRIQDGTHLHATIAKSEGKPDIRSMMVPLGPVAVFGASNFPLAFSVAGGDTASALAAKCPVIVKCHESHPGTSEMVAECVTRAVKDAGMPPVFAAVHGKHKIGQELVMHPLLQAVGFTGSLRGGKALMEASSKREVPIPVHAEMGSVNPVFLLPSSLERQDLGQLVLNSVTGSLGQMCTKPGLIVTVGEANNLMTNIRGLVSEISPGTMLTPAMRDSFEERVKKVSGLSGVQIFERGKSTSGQVTRAVAMTVSAADFLGNLGTIDEEMFGPGTVFVKCENIQEALKVAASLKGQLTGSIHGSEEELSQNSDLIASLSDKVGRLIINGFPTGVEVNSGMTHGGPFPASSDSRYTSVGFPSIRRWLRPVTYQNAPMGILPLELKNENPLGIWRRINDATTRDGVQ